MNPSEIQEMNFNIIQNNFFPDNLPYHPAFLTGLHELSPNNTYISSNSTSDEAEDHQHSLIDERKQRRMISNRESARRSRMRKQRHLDELWSQVTRLRTQNHNLIDKINHMSESHEKVVQENTRLKEETSNLRQMLTDLHISNSYEILRGFEDISCNLAHLKSEYSDQSVTTFLH
ncbi:basic-leucine zipper transcription factor family protein [Striga asiatica]|uniref:Basic-leucine zipper transcription factor family protein n=1 Tax=Striga asiatica TaxID=4170 RepID=A0A5A7QFR2_STRAF|nr:basic-leucine zipper transcription factor family protein [Striga asiatica]